MPDAKDNSTRDELQPIQNQIPILNQESLIGAWGTVGWVVLGAVNNELERYLCVIWQWPKSKKGGTPV